MGILGQLLVVVPFLLSLRYVLKGQPEKAFLNVYLPALLLGANYYVLHIPHLPDIAIEEGALIPLGIAVIIRSWRSWSLSRLDLWVLLYMLGQGISEGLNTSVPTALFVVSTAFCTPVLAYIVGKHLIEQQHLRFLTVQRIVVLLLIAIFPMLYEFRMGQNPYLMLSSHLFPDTFVGWGVQMRGGHARTAGPFGHAILAGMIFAAGLVFNGWLRYSRYRRAGSDLSNFAKLQRYFIPSLILLVGLLLTQSRGPMLAAGVAIMIAQIARFNRVRLAGAIIGGVLLVGAIAGYSYSKGYMNASVAQDEQQGSAIYRRELLENYAPIVEEGGWFGWGLTEFPRVGGQISIDNQYLLVEITQGRLGLILFLLIGAESFYALGKAIARARNRDDLMFAFSLMGIITGLFFSLLTVYLGPPVAQLIFLLAGWSTSLAVSETAPQAAMAPQARVLRRVLT